MNFRRWNVNAVATILMSVAALATSWAGYQATRWSGEQLRSGNQAFVLRTRSVRASDWAAQLRAVDVGVFTSWLSAYTRGDSALQRYLRKHFRKEFSIAFEAWFAQTSIEHDSSTVPFVLPQYHLAADDSAKALEEAADQASQRSAAANRTSDAYVLNAVILAMVMFFATASQQSTHSRSRWLTLGLAALACLGALVRMALAPIA